MKKLLSLLLVGVVAVSMFGFIRPNRVNAAEVNGGVRTLEKIIIKSNAKYSGPIFCEMSDNGKGVNRQQFTPDQPGIFTSKYTFYVYSTEKNHVNKIHLTFYVWDSTKPGTQVLIDAIFCKQEIGPSSKKELDAFSITIGKDGDSCDPICFNEWFPLSINYCEIYG